MAQITLIAPVTAAVTTKALVNAGDGDIILSANHLATTEEVDIYMDVGGTWVAVADDSGTVQKLTATVPMLVLAGGPMYAVAKDATATACGVYANTAVRLV